MKGLVLLFSSVFSRDYNEKFFSIRPSKLSFENMVAQTVQIVSLSLPEQNIKNTLHSFPWHIAVLFQPGHEHPTRRFF